MFKKLIIGLFLIGIFPSPEIYSQSTGHSQYFSVEKRSCENKWYKGFKLIIHYKSGNDKKEANSTTYSLHEFTDLSDSTRMKLVELLLLYKNDTSIVCKSVSNYGYEGYENTCRTQPESKIYSIQIEALYLINKLCFPHAASFYYCFPVVVDLNTDSEINDKHDRVAKYFEVYEKWFRETSKKENIDKEFPFNSGQFIWFGGRKSDVTN